MCTSQICLSSWPIVSSLKPEFVSQIHMVMVFGKSGKEALIVTRDKMVYALGTNIYSCLGTGNTEPTFYPKKIEVLCTKDVKTFACGMGPHVLALTNGGEVYSWGCNYYGQLGNGSDDQIVRLPTLVNIPTLENQGSKRIVDIACGYNHSVALTESGEVHVWGKHNYARKREEYEEEDVEEEEEIDTCITQFEILAGKEVVYISCGAAFTIVVIKNGEVYSWGDNNHGQLGVGDVMDRTMPCRLDSLKGAAIVKVACGMVHTLALTDEGDLYAWGNNNYGQLGIGNQTKFCKVPFMVEHQMGKVLDIAAMYCQYISIAVGREGCVYVWGYCHGQNIMTPIATPFLDIHNALASYGMMGVMHKPLILNRNEELDMLKCLRTAFDDPSTSDLKIQLGNQFIHVHKAILKIRSSYFRMMFQHVWAENNQSVIQHDQFSYVVYKAFLKYLYTNMVDLPWEQAIELLILANAYCENNLKKHCIRMLKQEITVANVAYLYSIAIKYNEEELEESCVKFAVNHLTVVAQTENFAKLDQNVMKTLIIKASKAGGFKM